MLRFSVLRLLPPPSAKREFADFSPRLSDGEKGEASPPAEEKREELNAEEELPAALKNFYERHEKIKSRIKKR